MRYIRVLGFCLFSLISRSFADFESTIGQAPNVPVSSVIAISTPASILASSGPPNNPPPITLPPLSDQSTTTRRKKNKKSKALPKPSLPLFLQLANDAQRKEYVDLTTNPNVGKGIKKQALQAWATRCGSNVMIAYQTFLADQLLIQQKRQQQIDAAIAGLSESAKAIHAKITAVVDNDNLSTTDENQQLAKIKKKADPAVWSELETAVGYH